MGWTIKRGGGAAACVVAAALACAAVPARAGADLIGKPITGRATFNSGNNNAFNANTSDTTPTPATVGPGLEFHAPSGGFTFQADVQSDRVVLSSAKVGSADAVVTFTVTLTGLYTGGNDAVTGGSVLSSTHNGGPAAVGVTPLAPGTIRIVVPGGPIGANGVQSTTVVFTTGLGNDACANAIPVVPGPARTPFSTVGATTDGPTHPVACNFFDSPGIANDVWFSYTAAATGLLQVNTCTSSTTFDTELAVYAAGTGGAGACPGSDATLLACNDDFQGCPNNTSGVEAPVTAGQAYLIRVGGYDGSGASGAGELRVFLVTLGACCNRWTGACSFRTQADCTELGLRFDGLNSGCSTSSCKACPADFNGQNNIDLLDIFAFLNGWFAGCP